MPAPAAERRRTWLVAGAFIALWAVYVERIPTFQAPDEPEHLAYVRALASGRLPNLPSLPEPVLVNGLVEGFRDAPTGLPAPLTYQAQQPPLAYLAGAGWWMLVDALRLPQRWVRGIGLIWGLLALWGLRLIARDAPLPDSTRRALPAVALLPAPVYLCAAVNNDGLSFALGTFLTWRLIRLLDAAPTCREGAVLAGLLAAALCCKLNAVLFVPFAAVLWFRAARRLRGPWRASAEAAGLVALALVPVALWGLRNHGLYGVWFPRAHARPTLVRIDYLWNHPDAPYIVWIQCVVIALAAPAAVLPAWLVLAISWDAYQAVVLAALAVAVVTGLGTLRLWRRPDVTPRAVLGLCLALFAGMVALLLHQFLFQDWEVGLHGARYYLPVLAAWLLVLLVSLDALCSPAQRARLPAVVALVFAAMTLAMAPLASFALGGAR